MTPDRPILIAGAGIAGLTAALAFAQLGFAVQVFERAERLDEAGAGIQLSPNATHNLFSLGLRDALLPVAPRPEAVGLVDAKTLRELAHVPLGAWGEARWGAPYLTCRRADLQRVLLDAVLADPRIALRTGASVAGAELSGGSPTLIFGGSAIEPASGAFIIAADGAHSELRKFLPKQAIGFDVVPPLRPASRSASPPSGGRRRVVHSAGLAPFLSLRRGERWLRSRRSGGATPERPALPTTANPLITGLTAWRATLDMDALDPQVFRSDRVSAFLKPKAHLVAYPTGGERFNLVAFTGTRGPSGGTADAEAFRQAFTDASPALKALAEGGEWTAWPLLAAPDGIPWVFGSAAALIGDAAHAMTPFAAQGAAMAIEDAATLAAAFAATDGAPEARLSAWERKRRARIAKVMRRGRLNQLTWHAAGPVALARNLVLRLLPPEKLARDLDWLYGWRPDRLPP